VPAGTPCHRSGGDTFAPSQVYRAAIGPPALNAGLVNAIWPNVGSLCALAPVVDAGGFATGAVLAGGVVLVAAAVVVVLATLADPLEPEPQPPSAIVVASAAALRAV
jgi:hypothetical protein